MKSVLRALISLPVIALVIGIGATGCSSSATSATSPTSPSAPATGATIQGTVQTGATVSSSQMAAFSAVGGIKVTLVGSNLSTSTDSSGRFALQGVTGGNAALRFQGKGIDATVELGGLVEGQTLTITVQVSGSQAQLVSPSSPAASPTPPPTEDKVDLSGTVESITPPRLQVGGRTVVTNADTKIKRGEQTIALTDLKVGDKVEVEGMPQADGSVLASKIKVETDENGNQNQNDEQVDLSGHIDSISAPTLMVSGHKVVTNGSTRIRRGNNTMTFADLKVGDKVEVQGTSEPDGSVLASQIKVEGSGDEQENNGEGS